jgi:PAS domain S-box-containing protein
VVFSGPNIHVFHSVTRADEILGTIEIVADLSQLSQRLGRYAGIAALVLVVSLSLVFLLSARLARVVSGPILALAAIARQVAAEKNYALRAPRGGADEIGRLVEGFNEMLAEIERRDEELRAARDGLERRVGERTTELASSVSLLNATIDSTTDGILAVDRGGRVMCCNRQFIEMWGLPPPTLAARDALAMAAASAAQVRDPERFLADVDAIRRAPEQSAFDVLELSDGRIFERYVKPQMLDGRCTGQVLNFRDVTERRRAEAALQENERKFRALFEHAVDGIVIHDLEGRILDANPAMCRRLHYSREEFLRLRLADIDLPEATGQLAARTRELQERGSLIFEVVHRRRDGGVVPVEVSCCLITLDGRRLVLSFCRDLTDRKAAEEKLEAVHKQLLATSRQAGMAEVATGVLHNVGNVLNSVNVSATLIAEQLRRSEVAHLARVGELLRQHDTDLGRFFTEDARGRQVPRFLEKLAAHLAAERATNLHELEALHKNVEHIKEIVAMQQSYAKVSGVAETVALEEIVEDALRMNAGALVRHDVTLVRDYRIHPTVTTERHKILQILVNLIRNAKYACDDARRDDKRVTVRIAGDDDRVQVAVVDNGVGIPAENLTRIFSHGFTTRKDGHGFGLHSGALAARELGGTLAAESAGPGQGATFVLTLPRAHDAPPVAPAVALINEAR